MKRATIVSVLGAAGGMLFATMDPASGEDEGWCETTSSAVPACLVGPCDYREERNAWIPEPGRPFLRIRVKFNILSSGASGGDVTDEIAQINDNFENSKIAFDVTPERLTESEFYNETVTSVDDADDIKEAHADNPSGQLNVYVVNINFGGPVPVRGWAVFPWDDDATGVLGGIVIDDGAFGTRPGKIVKILTHEIGHIVGLWHSFHGGAKGELLEHGGCSGPDPSGHGCNCRCYERADRTDEEGDHLGDMCGDTPAIPGSPELSQCEQPTGFHDLCSGVPWQAFVDRNYMSTKEDRTCPNRFTSQQRGRTHCWSCDELAGWIVGETRSGACCLPDGSCDVRGPICCEDKGGTFIGA